MHLSVFVLCIEREQTQKRSIINESEKMEESRREEEKRVMIAMDESDSSKAALEWALSNLKPNLTAGGVILFTVVPLDYSAVFAGAYGTAAPVDITPELMNCVQEKQKKSAIAVLNKAKNLCANHGVDAECFYKFGNVKEAICDAASKYQVQMLLLGSHGKGAIKRALVGSVSNYCVNNAKCPVLVVKKPSA